RAGQGSRRRKAGRVRTWRLRRERPVVRGIRLNVCDAARRHLSASGWRRPRPPCTIGMGCRGEKVMRRRAWIAGLLAPLAGGMAQAETWHCRNDVEVQCGAGGCSAAAEGGFTPMDLAFADDGGLSLCAYSGCWEGSGEVLARAPWLVVGARGLPW